MKNRILRLALIGLVFAGFSSYADDLHIDTAVNPVEVAQNLDKKKDNISYAKTIAGFIAKSVIIGASEGLSYTAYTACGGGVTGNLAGITTNAVTLTCVKICEQYKKGNLTLAEAVKSIVPHELWSSSSYFSKHFIASSLLAACSLAQSCPQYTGIPSSYIFPVSLAIKAFLFEKPLQESATYNLSSHIIDLAPKPDVSNIV